MTRYIGLDAHLASCTVAVLGPSGKKITEQVLETNAKVLVEFVRAIARPRHLCFEEGILSAWLYEVMRPHVDDVVVTTDKKKGIKSDHHDALTLAEKLRTNSFDKRVYKDVGRYAPLREWVCVHRDHVRDSVRLKNRIWVRFASRSIETAANLYEPELRQQWLNKLPAHSRTTTELMMREHDAIQQMRHEAEKALIQESKKHHAAKLLAKVPGIGAIRAAQLIAIILTPHRFRTRRQLWNYAGLAIVTRSSSDWTPTKHGGWNKMVVAQTRGLNRDHNSMLKAIFKGAALTVISKSETNCPLRQHYDRMVANNIKPNLARLTLARQIAAICLSSWKKEVAYNPAMVSKKT
jgi:transposase